MPNEITSAATLSTKASKTLHLMRARTVKADGMRSTRSSTAGAGVRHILEPVHSPAPRAKMNVPTSAITALPASNSTRSRSQMLRWISSRRAAPV